MERLIIQMRTYFVLFTLLTLHSVTVSAGLQEMVKDKREVIPLQARCSPEGVERYSCTLP